MITGPEWTHKRGVAFLVVLLACVMIASGMKTGFEGFGMFINHTPSMPLGFYRHVSGTIVKGSIITFCPPPAAVAYQHRWHPEEDGKSRACPSGQEPYVKYSAAVAGDVVDVRPDGVHVNDGPALPGSRPLVRIGTGLSARPMPSVIGKNWKLKDGETWAATQEWYSMDSRYYGPVLGARPAVMLLVSPNSPQTEAPDFIKKMQEQK